MHHPAVPFQVQLATLVEGVNHLRIEGSGEDAGLTPNDADLQGGIVLEGDFIRVDQRVEIQARVEGTVRLECGRCVAPLSMPIRAPLRLFCEKRGERDRRTDAESREQDEGLLYHDGRVLDLAEEVREAFLLEIPWTVVCRPDCRGLCPQCGQNLNVGDCSCPPHRGTSPWDRLRDRLEGSSSPRSDREKES